MKAISIRQPWAWAILHAGKDVENRDWKESSPNLRDARRLMSRVLLIHTGKSMTRDEYEDGLDTMHMVSKRRPFPSGLTLPAFDDLPRGGIVGKARLAGLVSDACSPDEYTGDRRKARGSPWYFGSLGLVLVDTKPVKFVPCNGRLGFFDVPDNIVREVVAA